MTGTNLSACASPLEFLETPLDHSHIKALIFFGP
jgi:hypothetical protein